MESEPKAFAAGDRVEEVGSGLRGMLLGPGRFAGEWRVLLEDQSTTVFLEENLRAVGLGSSQRKPLE
jgi:hypothetical protein